MANSKCFPEEGTAKEGCSSSLDLRLLSVGCIFPTVENLVQDKYLLMQSLFFRIIVGMGLLRAEYLQQEAVPTESSSQSLITLLERLSNPEESSKGQSLLCGSLVEPRETLKLKPSI